MIMELFPEYKPILESLKPIPLPTRRRVNIAKQGQKNDRKNY